MQQFVGCGCNRHRQMKTKSQKQFDHQTCQTRRSPAEQNLRPATVGDISCDDQPATDSWPRTAERLIPNVMQVLNATLADAITGGVRSDDKIAEIVCRHSGRWPVPDEYLGYVETFIISYCTKASRPDRDPSQSLPKDTSPIMLRRPRFLVFHNGKNHYYSELSEHILRLRGNALFWICPSQNEFLSRGEQRDKRECPPARALRMLRFLCLERNAGRIIPFSELYSYVWEPVSLPSKEQICNSINVAQNEINNFADKRFISDESKNDNARVIRIRGQDKFTVGEATPQECCIIKAVTWS